MCTDPFRPLKTAAIPVIAAWAFVCGPALADPVSASPTVPLTSTTKDNVSEALRASELGERSVVDVFDADPAKEAAASAKANADRRAALAALGLQPQQGTQRQGAAQAGQTAPARLQGGGIAEASPYGAPATRSGKDGATAAAPAEADPLKEAVRPLYDEISKSGIADAMRGLKADLKAQLSGDKEHEGDAASANAKPKEASPATSTNTASSNDSGPLWTPPPSADPRFPPKTAAQIERDRMLAAAGMETLIAGLQPWIIGLLVLASLAVTWRMTLRYLRALEHKRRRRRFAHSQPPQSQPPAQAASKRRHSAVQARPGHQQQATGQR